MGSSCAPVTEGDVQSLILAAITRLPKSLFWRNNTGKLRDRRGRLVSFGLNGSADIIGCYHGFAVYLEVKLPGQKQRPDQMIFENAVRRADGIYAVVCSVDGALAVLRPIAPDS
jgi:hypothetical protein